MMALHTPVWDRHPLGPSQPTAAGTVLRMRTAGTTLTLRDLTGTQAAALSRAAGLAPDATAGADADGSSDGEGGTPDVRVVLERGRERFDTSGMAPVTRGVWARGDTVVLDSVGGSGFCQAWRVAADHVLVRARWCPSKLEHGATVLRSRFDALRAQVLLNYPALWWAGTQALAPLHVSVVEVDGVVVVLAGPGGVGKSTLVAQALSRGARATCDNLATCDGDVAHGLREPLRLAVSDGGSTSGARTTHGRRETAWTGRVASLRPDLVVVVRRGGAAPGVRDIEPDVARRALVAGTYAAGELRRFWGLTAVLGLATGRGPVQPAVDEVARRLTSRLPCLELELGTRPDTGPDTDTRSGLETLLADHLDIARRTEAAR